jgi:hypothetical protein
MGACGLPEEQTEYGGKPRIRTRHSLEENEFQEKV